MASQTEEPSWAATSSTATAHAHADPGSVWRLPQVALESMTHWVGPKGQVVIPEALREELGIASGDEVVVWREGDHIALAPPASERPLRGRFRERPLVKQLEAERRDDRRREASR